MNQTRLMELVVGLFVCLGLAAVFLLTLQVSTRSDLERQDAYTIKARFDNVGSLRDFDTVAPYSAEARRQLAQPRSPARPAEPNRS